MNIKKSIKLVILILTFNTSCFASQSMRAYPENLRIVEKKNQELKPMILSNKANSKPLKDENRLMFLKNKNRSKLLKDEDKPMSLSDKDKPKPSTSFEI